MTMENNSLFNLAGWCGYIAAGATILGFITIIIFFMVGDPFGIMNDISSVVIALAGIPILLAMHQLHRSARPALSLIAFVIGIVAVLVVAATQTMLVLKIIKYEQSAAPATIGFGVFGASLILFGYLSYIANTFSRRMSVWGIFAGLGYILVTAGFLLGLQEHPLSYIGGVMTVIAFPTWAVMLGKQFVKSS